MVSEKPHRVKAERNIRGEMGHFGLYWLVWVRVTQVEWHLEVDSW